MVRRHKPSEEIVLGKLESGKPLSILLEEMREKHWAIVGPTGQRKTLFTIWLFLQYVALQRDSCIFVDLGGDVAALWLLEQAARDAGKMFYFFSLSEQHDSCSWDPIHGTPAFAKDTGLATSGITQGLKLVHQDATKAYWSKLNKSVVNEAFDGLRIGSSELPCFVELTAELKRMGKGTGQYISEAYLAADQLMRFSALTGTNRVVLNLAQAIEEGAVIVFHLPTILHGDEARAVASLLVWAVMCETADRTNSGKSLRNVHLAIDEYAQVAQAKSNFDAGLTMSRKFGLHFYLLFQDFEQLKTSSGDLGPVVRSQCQRVVFSATSREEIDELRNRSLDITRDDISASLRGMGRTTSVREVEEPGLSRNSIMKRSGVALDAYAVLNLGDQHRDPIPFTIIPPTKSVAEHNQLKKKPLPSKQQAAPFETITTSNGHPTDSAIKERRAKLLDLATRITAESAWELGK